MEKPLQCGCVMADVIASGRWKNHKVNYFNFSSEVLNRTSSQTCGRWYLPTFLFRDGSLTLMYRAYFIVLIRFKSSLPTMLKLLMVTRTFGERFKEHLKPTSPIYDHSDITGHNVTINNFTIVGREDMNVMRTIKEALYIRVNDPSLNRNVGKYHLPHVWDEVLFNTSELKLK